MKPRRCSDCKRTEGETEFYAPSTKCRRCKECWRAYLRDKYRPRKRARQAAATDPSAANMLGALMASWGRP